MMSWYHRFKPAASIRTQLLTAALMWTGVGIGLLAAGIIWSRAVGEARLAVFTSLALVVGLLKGWFVLRRSAIRIAARIARRGDGRCLGGFISWKTWIMVAIMMLLGRSLRHGLVPRPVVAFIYEAVGVALLAGAMTLWAAFGRRDSYETFPGQSREWPLDAAPPGAQK